MPEHPALPAASNAYSLLSLEPTKTSLVGWVVKEMGSMMDVPPGLNGTRLPEKTPKN